MLTVWFVACALFLPILYLFVGFVFRVTLIKTEVILSKYWFLQIKVFLTIFCIVCFLLLRPVPLNYFIITKCVPNNLTLNLICKRCYGARALVLFNSYQRIAAKLAQCRNNCTFLRACDKEQLVCKGFFIKNRFSPSAESYLREVSRKLQKLEINYNFSKIASLRQDIHFLLRNLHNLNFSSADLATVDNFTQTHYNYCFKLAKQRQVKKLFSLRKETAKIVSCRLWPDKKFRDNLIANLGNFNFNDYELDILALGPKILC